MDEDDAAGLGDGGVIEFEAATIYQLGNYGFSGVGSEGFAIGQSVAQIGR